MKSDVDKEEGERERGRERRLYVVRDNMFIWLRY
jgi:hypothetical protein